MTKNTEHFIVIRLEGRTVDKDISIKIPDSEVDILYDADTVSFDIIKKTLDQNTILRKDKSEKIRIEKDDDSF